VLQPALPIRGKEQPVMPQVQRRGTRGLLSQSPPGAAEVKFDMRLKKKPSKTTRKGIIKKLDTLFSLQVRDRDGHKCRMCGSNVRTYCHHLFSRRHLGTRWTHEASVSLCYFCHRAKAHGDPEAFRDWVLSWMSGQKFNELKWKAYTPTKYTLNDLLFILRQMTGA
jgi:5-methylcytosine-specific restriction endonuclease McrA